MAYDSRTDRHEVTDERRAQIAARRRSADDGRRERTARARRDSLERHYREDS